MKASDFIKRIGDQSEALDSKDIAEAIKSVRTKLFAVANELGSLKSSVTDSKIKAGLKKAENLVDKARKELFDIQ